MDRERTSGQNLTMIAPEETRIANELAQGRRLAEQQPEAIWGWETTAGQLRAIRRAKLVVEGAQMTPGCLALEIGCGSGMFTEIFARSGARIVAVDLSTELLELARARGLPKDQVTFVESPFEAYSPEGLFDCVIGSSVLHHLDIQRAFARIFELLRPTGRMSFAEPNMLNPQVYLERRFRQFFPSVTPDETAFVRSRLKRELEACGFQGVEIEPFDWLHPATPPLCIQAVSKVGSFLERMWLLREFSGSLAIRAEKPG